MFVNFEMFERLKNKFIVVNSAAAADVRALTKMEDILREVRNKALSPMKIDGFFL